MWHVDRHEDTQLGKQVHMHSGLLCDVSHLPGVSCLGPQAQLFPLGCGDMISADLLYLS